MLKKLLRLRNNEKSYKLELNLISYKNLLHFYVRKHILLRCQPIAINPERLLQKYQFGLSCFFSWTGLFPGASWLTIDSINSRSIGSVGRVCFWFLNVSRYGGGVISLDILLELLGGDLISFSRLIASFEYLSDKNCNCPKYWHIGSFPLPADPNRTNCRFRFDWHLVQPSLRFFPNRLEWFDWI